MVFLDANLPSITISYPSFGVSTSNTEKNGVFDIGLKNNWLPETSKLGKMDVHGWKPLCRVCQLQSLTICSASPERPGLTWRPFLRIHRSPPRETSFAKHWSSWGLFGFSDAPARQLPLTLAMAKIILAASNCPAWLGAADFAAIPFQDVFALASDAHCFPSTRQKVWC